MTAQSVAHAVFAGGFPSPVFDAQSVFRSVMDAMARPGTVQPVATAAQAPAPLAPVAAALVLTLCDADTHVWLDAPLSDNAEIAQWLAFHTGASVTADASEATFALIADGASLASLERFGHGTQDYPDRSTTLIVQTDSLMAGPPLNLRGPGIKTHARLAPAGLPDRFVELWAANNALFPRGIDLVLAAPGEIAALPRTTRVTTGEG